MIRMPPQSVNHATAAIRRETDRRALLRLGVMFACGLVLTIGFVRAAGQHTAAVHTGYRSEELRREHARLLSEQRRLMLALSEAQSPSQLERAAREIGLEPASSRQLELSASKAFANRVAPVIASATVTRHATPSTR